MRSPLKIFRISAVSIIIKLNILVFLLWLFFSPEFMYLNFLVSWDSLQEGRPWTLVTSEFSHNYFFHLLVNMFAFYGFGLAMERHLGTKRFVLFYLMAAITASLGHSVVSNLILNRPGLPALGASGAVAGVILLFSLTYPKEKILLLGIIPLPAITAALLFVGLDLWGLSAQANGGSLPIGHGAHLGGALYGLIYFLFLKVSKSKPIQ
jgi:membrane associated rhomboid family serine protease